MQEKAILIWAFTKESLYDEFRTRHNGDVKCLDACSSSVMLCHVSSHTKQNVNKCTGEYRIDLC